MNQLLSWDVTRSSVEDRIYEAMSVDQRHDLIAHIAINMIQEAVNRKSGSYESKKVIKDIINKCIERPEFRNIIDNNVNNNIDIAEALFCSIQEQDGLIVEKINGEFSFIHECIQNYFAAYYLSKLTPSEWKEYLFNLKKEYQLKKEEQSKSKIFNLDQYFDSLKEEYQSKLDIFNKSIKLREISTNDRQSEYQKVSAEITEK